MGALARAVLGIREPKRPQANAAEMKKRAYEIRTVNDIPYFKELLRQLEEAAQQPVAVGNHAEMIEQIGKLNAFREFLSRLKKDLDTAERIVAGDQARQRQR